MPSTAREAFNSVTQDGSWGSWDNIANLAFPDSGESAAVLSTNYSSFTNNLYFSLHEGMDAVPDGSAFVSMSLEIYRKKSGLFQASAQVDVFGGTNINPSVWETANIQGTYNNAIRAGDRAFWGLEAYTPQQIITMLKDGALIHRVRAREDVGFSGSNVFVHVKDITLVVEYTEPTPASSSGRRGAVLIGW